VTVSAYELGSPRARALLETALGSDPARLDLAALSLSALFEDSLDIDGSLKALDALASRVQLPTRTDALTQVQAIKRVLVDEEGFRGNQQKYFEPQNSFLPEVLQSRQGIPITLSVVWLEVARRAGVPLYGVGFPGHFVIAIDADEHKLVIDPFHDGRILTEEGCEDLLHQVAPQVKFTPSMIAPAATKTIAYRMLTNLKRLYLDRGDGERALKVVDLMLVVAPDHPGELRARAAILSALGAYRAALVDIERCLELSPASPDHDTLVMTAKALRQRVEHLN
jgi:regulator of sirC expression with transglutaminase-like and TPR domain